MANRYWIGGTADWDNIAESKWSTTSGGGGGASVPTSTDDVFFDGNSGTNTITLTLSRDCHNLDCTGFTGTITANPTSSDLRISGNIILAATGTYTVPFSIIFGGGAKTITTNNATLNSITILPQGSDDIIVTLVGNLIVTKLFRVSSLTRSVIFDAAGYNVTCGQFFSNDDTVKTVTIIMGSGIWTITGYDNQYSAISAWKIQNTYDKTTLNSNTSTLKFTNNSSSNKTLEGVTGFSFYNIWNATQGSGIFKINKSNTFNNIKIDPGRTVQFTDATNQTVSSLTWDGTLGNVITVTGTATGGWTITDTSGNNVVNYCNISYSTATGGAVFDAQNSGNVNGGNNSGWRFAYGINVSDQINITESKTALVPTNFVNVYDSVNIAQNETKNISQFTTTQAVSSVSTLTATGNGTIVTIGSANATLRGVVWSTSSWGNPGNVAPASSNYGGKSEASGSFGVGAFTSSMTGLVSSTTYYVRAYSYNTWGYVYGDEVSFTTEGFLNPQNAYSSDDTYATLTSADGDLSVELSKDAGANWTAPLTKTFGGSDTLETYGAGATELWGSAFTRADMTDTNFRVRLSHGSIKQVYNGFGFTTGTNILTGIEIAVEAHWINPTLSIDVLKAKIYYGTSILPVQPGSQAYASDGRKAGEGAGAGTGVLVYYDSANNWIASDTGAVVAA
jgi:hypothetical protein